MCWTTAMDRDADYVPDDSVAWTGTQTMHMCRSRVQLHRRSWWQGSGMGVARESMSGIN